jgi:GH25 family lysozyme M1 (1,4-beta-N-acetylmuramidase)
MSYFVRNQEFAFGIDLSRYNTSADLREYPNFDQIAAHEPQIAFVAMRTGQSWAEKDPTFEHYFREATRIGACILPYHVIFPGEPALKQIDNLMRILGGIDLTHVRLVLDVELDHKNSRAMITNTLVSCLELLRQETGRYPIIYSRASFVDSHLQIEDLPWLDWWLAQYHYSRPFPAYTPEFPCPPKLPRRVTHWLIHQTTDKGPAIGGVGTYMDYDRWNGDKQDVLKYFGRTNTPVKVLCPLNSEPCCRESQPSQPVRLALPVEA